MKKLAYISLVILLLLGLTGCGLPQNVKTQEKQALAIAESVKTPNPRYNETTGQLLVSKGKITIMMISYDAETDNPTFTIELTYRNKGFFSNTIFSPIPQIYVLSTGITTHNQFDNTLAELQQYQSQLVWK